MDDADLKDLIHHLYEVPQACLKYLNLSGLTVDTKMMVMMLLPQERLSIRMLLKQDVVEEQHANKQQLIVGLENLYNFQKLTYINSYFKTLLQ